VIAPESIRASWCISHRDGPTLGTSPACGRDCGMIGTVEWICTTGGERPRSHHYARSIACRLGSVPVGLILIPDDDFGPRPEIDVVLTIDGSNSICVLRKLPPWLDNPRPWELPKALIEVPVIQDEHLGSCRSKIIRDYDYISDHFCDVDEMRRMRTGDTPTRNAEDGEGRISGRAEASKRYITRERYMPRP
jgi:hypothetical protein